MMTTGRARRIEHRRRRQRREFDVERIGGWKALPLRCAAVDRVRIRDERKHAHVSPDFHRRQLDRSESRRVRLQSELRDLRREVRDELVLGAHGQLEAIAHRLRELL
jgi:hypothetical protein